MFKCVLESSRPSSRLILTFKGSLHPINETWKNNMLKVEAKQTELLLDSTTFTGAVG